MRTSSRRESLERWLAGAGELLREQLSPEVRAQCVGTRRSAGSPDMARADGSEGREGCSGSQVVERYDGSSLMPIWRSETVVGM